MKTQYGPDTLNREHGLMLRNETSHTRNCLIIIAPPAPSTRIALLVWPQSYCYQIAASVHHRQCQQGRQVPPFTNTNSTKFRSVQSPVVRVLASYIQEPAVRSAIVSCWGTRSKSGVQHFSFIVVVNAVTTAGSWKTATWPRLCV